MYSCSLAITMRNRSPRSCPFRRTFAPLTPKNPPPSFTRLRQPRCTGWSYQDRGIPRANLAASYPAALPNHLNIGVLHTALTEWATTPCSLRPCSPAELSGQGYHYWALGHVHDFEVVSESPFIVFPGNLQGRNIRECGAKGAVIVTVEEDGAIVEPPRPIPLDAVRWARVGVDAENLEHDRDIQNRVRDGLNQAFSDAEGRPLVARVTITGRTALHGDLARRREQLREDVRGIAIAISDQLWIEKVAVNTEALPAQVLGAASALEELGALLGSGSQEAGTDQCIWGGDRRVPRQDSAGSRK